MSGTQRSCTMMMIYGSAATNGIGRGKKIVGATEVLHEITRPNNPHYLNTQGSVVSTKSTSRFIDGLQQDANAVRTTRTRIYPEHTIYGLRGTRRMLRKICTSGRMRMQYRTQHGAGTAVDIAGH
ncbi:unnamed protein product [Ectocarpus sp. 4 AP-2014]